jgi:hypothetical protein
MHEQGIIGYVARKNGVGIRIFLNRAARSIAKSGSVKREAGSEKILRFPRASNDIARASLNEAAFNDNYVDLDNLEIYSSSDAPKNGATTTSYKAPATRNQRFSMVPVNLRQRGREVPTHTLDENDVVRRILAELKPAIQAASTSAARLEHERIRDWLENRGLPKAARVAQHEAYNILRKHGVITPSRQNSKSQIDVGRNGSPPTPTPRLLGDYEIDDLARSCLALLESRGQSIETTLSEMSIDAGGLLLPEDAHRVRANALALLTDGTNPGGNI